MAAHKAPVKQGSDRNKTGHAIVIGGGIGGLLAAHVLRHHYARVSLIERSGYPAATAGSPPAARAGVPQSHCLHLLMGAGVLAFDRIVPGWREAAMERGAVPFDACADAVLRLPSGWLPRFASGIQMYACSRGLLENVLASELTMQDGAGIVQNGHVSGLIGDSSGKRVAGVRITDPQSGSETELAADLVVDASGAASRLRHWLGDFSGHPVSGVAETLVQPGRQYVSRWFHLAPSEAPDWQCLSASPAQNTTGRAAMMLRAENNFWGVVLLAAASDSVPDNDLEFLDFIASLDNPPLQNALSRARPVSAIHRYGQTTNRMRHYDKLPCWPQGLIALGDSVCALDPYFGLGMTNAALGSTLLMDRLNRDGAPQFNCLSFQKTLAVQNARPWQLATGRDPSGCIVRHDQKRLGQLYEAAISDAGAARSILEVQHLLSPPETLMEGAVA